MKQLRNFGLAAFTMAGLTMAAVAAAAPAACAQAAMPDVTAMPVSVAVIPTVSMQLRQDDPQRDVILLDYPGDTHGGYLGVGVQDLSDDRVTALKLKQAGGVEVVALDHDGPAAKAGIHEHDVILQMNGQEIAGAEQLRRMLRETPAGSQGGFSAEPRWRRS